MISSVLVVCIGNICRSPVGEGLLKKMCPNLTIESAGLGALVGYGPDETARQVAEQNCVNVNSHRARQFVADLASGFDLILVMEKSHLDEVRSQAPQVSGKTMLIDHWSGQRDIRDPYKKSPEFHTAVFKQLENACAGWAAKLTGNPND